MSQFYCSNKTRAAERERAAELESEILLEEDSGEVLDMEIGKNMTF